jgi:hypothetical protein
MAGGGMGVFRGSRFMKNSSRLANSRIVALTICMRKILTILNAVVRDNQPWNPHRKQHA